jgi:hypothetical protein
LKDSQEIFELIERYLTGDLSQAEKLEVEKRIHTDSAFAQEVESARFVNQVVMGAEMDKLREKMTRDLARLGTGNNNSGNWLAGGISLLIVISGGLFIYNSSGDDNSIPQEKIVMTEVVTADKNVADGSGSDIVSIGSQAVGTEAEKNIIRAEVKTEIQNNLSVPAISEEAHYEPEIMESENSDSEYSSINLKPAPEHQQKHIEKTCYIDFIASVTPSCRGEKNGEIEIDRNSIKGSSGVVSFSLRNSDDQSEDGRFSGLGEGKYVVIIKDKNGCAATKDVQVGSKNCSVKKVWSFNPDYGEHWKIEYQEGEVGKFTIMNKAGITIFKGLFGNNAEDQWNGTDQDGNSAEAGLYIAVLEYQNGKTETVQITVVR